MGRARGAGVARRCRRGGEDIFYFVRAWFAFAVVFMVKAGSDCWYIWEVLEMEDPNRYDHKTGEKKFLSYEVGSICECVVSGVLV